jgi:hypothetical protein
VAAQRPPKSARKNTSNSIDAMCPVYPVGRAHPRVRLCQDDFATNPPFMVSDWYAGLHQGKNAAAPDRRRSARYAMGLVIRAQRIQKSWPFCEPGTRPACRPLATYRC